MGTSLQELKDRIDAAKGWIDDLVQPADQTGQKVVKMHPSMALAVKHLSGNGCEELRQVGYQRKVGGAFGFFQTYMDYVGFGNLRHGVPAGVPDQQEGTASFDSHEVRVWFTESKSDISYGFDFKRTYNSDGSIKYEITKVTPYSTLSGTVEVWFGDTRIWNDLNSVSNGTTWSTTTWASIGDKYFIRTEMLPAAKILRPWDSAKADDIEAFCERFWSDTTYDIYSPTYDQRPNGFPFVPSFLYTKKLWQDIDHAKGCPTDLPRDVTSGFHGYPHSSKVVENFAALFTWRNMTRMDPLVVIPNAIHYLNITHNAGYPMREPALGDNFLWNVWGMGSGEFASKLIPTISYPATPLHVADFMTYWFLKDDIGMPLTFAVKNPISHYVIPKAIPGLDDQVPFPFLSHVYLPETPKVGTSLRTNLMAVLLTVLGYSNLLPVDVGVKYRLAATNLVENVLLGTQWGFAPYNTYEGISLDVGKIRRPQWQGAQMFAWQPGSDFRVPTFGLLRQLVNNQAGLPPNDDDLIISTVETTASFCQALRVYLYFKYLVAYPNDTNLPLQSDPVVHV